MEVSLRDQYTSEELQGRVGNRRIDAPSESGLRWFGHVSRKDENNWVRCNELVVVGQKAPWED